MGMVPFWHVFDGYELPDTDTRQLTDPQQAWALIDQLKRRPVPAHVRIQRLLTLLSREFPDDPPGTPAQACIWEDGLSPRPAYVDAAAYSLEIGAGGFEHLLPRALTLARELLLDVVDDLNGVYVPIRGLPLPQTEGIQYLRALLHPRARRPWTDMDALRQALKAGLTQRLEPLGFDLVTDKGSLLRFERHMTDGLQRITAHIGGQAKSLRCNLHIEQRPPADGRSGRAPLSTTLEALRLQNEPAWGEERSGRPFIRLAITAFWVDWMLEDLSKWGLPLLTSNPDTPGGASPAESSGTAGNEQAGAMPWGLVPTEEESEAATSLQALRQRAQQGDAQAMLELAYAYVQGQHTEANPVAAAELFRKAADLGLDAAMYNLGVCYWRGDGLEENTAEAIHWFVRAADRGHGHAMYMLGMAYRNGIGVPRDVAVSNALMLVAGAKGVAKATAEGVIAGAGPWSELAKAFVEHRVSVTLEARHPQPTPSAPDTAASAAAQRPATPAGQRSAVAGASPSKASPQRHRPAENPPSTEPLALWAAACGALGWLAVLLLGGSPPSGGAMAVHALGVLAGAFGVYRLSAALGHGGPVRWALTLLALVPGIGALTCAVQLIRSLRSD